MLSAIKVVLGAVVHIDRLDAWTNRDSASATVKMVLRAPHGRHRVRVNGATTGRSRLGLFLGAMGSSPPRRRPSARTQGAYRRTRTTASDVRTGRCLVQWFQRQADHRADTLLFS
jgi:hypothetical protein